MILRCRAVVVGLVVCLLLMLLTVAVTNRQQHQHQQSSSLLRPLVWKGASVLLASMGGVRGLCHATSDQYAPTLAHCNENENTALRIPVRGDNRNDNLQVQQQPPRTLGEENDDDNDGDDDDMYQYWRRRYDDQYFDEFFDTASDAETSRSKNRESHSRWFYLIHASLTLFCVTVGAIASGLYIGLLSLDPLLLVIKSRTASSEEERNRATNLLALVKQRHQLIVTLLIVNCMAAEAMPIFLQRLLHDSAAILMSVLLVLVFGEIIPSILFTGVDQLVIASRLAPIVRLLMFLLFPIVWPIAHLMECLSSMAGGSTLSDDTHGGGPGRTGYNRGELAALIRVQYEERRALREQRKQEAVQESSLLSLNELDDSLTHSAASTSLRCAGRRRAFHKQMSVASIDSHDVNIMEGALQLKIKTAMDVFLRFHKVFCAPHDMILDEANIFTIYATGFSRVPVYVDGNRRRIKGILMTRQLMVVKRSTTHHTHASNSSGDNSSKQQPRPMSPSPPLLADLALHTPQCVAPETNLADLINLFQTGGRTARAGHMALVCARPHVGNEALEMGGALPERAGLMGYVTSSRCFGLIPAFRTNFHPEMH